MRIFYNLSIRNKLIAIILFVTILALGSGFTFVIINDIKSFKKEMLEHTTVTTQVIGDYCISPLAFRDNEGAEQILSKLTTIPSIINASVFDSDGKLFASFDNAKEPVIFTPSLHKPFSIFENNSLIVSQSIVYKSEHYGTINMHVSTLSLKAKINNYLRYMLILMAGLTVGSIFLAIKLQNLISQPILNLAGVAQQIAHEKNYSIRIEKKGHDETGHLYDGFNNMLDQIQNREQERDKAEETLKKYNLQLEQEIHERKLAEEALRESENKFRTLTSNIPGAVYRCANDPSWTMDFLSDVIKDISGYDASDFIWNKIRSYSSIIHPQDRDMVYETIHEGLSNKEPYIIDYQIVTADGKIKWVYEKGQGVFDQDDKLLWLDGVIFDITERKNAELELARHKDHLEELVDIRTSELTDMNKQLQDEITIRIKAEDAFRSLSSRYEAILESVPDIIMEVDSNKFYTWANQAGFEFFGKEVLGKEASFYFEGEQDIYDMVQPLFNGDENVVYVESYQRRQDGEKRLLAWWCRVLKDDAGNILGALSTARDISDQKRAEEALRKSEKKYRSLVANIPDVTWTSDSKGKTVFISPNIEKVYGFTAEEIYQSDNRTWFGRIHPEDFAHVIKSYELLFTKNKIFDVTYRIQKKDGQWIWLHDRAIATYERDGVLYADGVFSDITERVQTEKELKDTQAQLLQSEKMASLGMLVAGVAHEINTPVGAINSMYNTLVRALDKLKIILRPLYATQPNESQKVDKLFTIIENADKVIASGTERVTNIVSRLKSFARIDENTIMKKVNIHEGIEDTLTIVHHELKHKAVVKRNFGDIPPITCNPGQLNQVYLNLLVNAIQAIKDKGTITITTLKKNYHVHIQIKDDGVGIPEAELKKIFDPGFTTKGVGVGTGLGLSICYQIVKDHHGEILVESEIDKGTTFTIILPLMTPAENN